MIHIAKPPALYCLLTLLAGVGAVGCVSAPVKSEQTFSGTLEDGALWQAKVPDKWNGTLLLYGHGYGRKAGLPDVAPKQSEAFLLANGYALAASQYPEAGWSVEKAIPSQLLALQQFRNDAGAPERIIAWGSSMGGLITSAIAQRHADQVDGTISLCASSYGALPMMDTALDGAFVFTRLLFPGENIPLTGRGHDRETVERLITSMEDNQQDPRWQARAVLAGVLGGLPDWTIPGSEAPETPDAIAQHMMAAVKMGLFLPRGDQERRAGGSFSSNTGVDYRTLLDASGRKSLVEAVYQKAGLSLSDDLRTLEKAQRIASVPGAVSYMADNFTPDGVITKPMLAMHTTGDGMTSPSLQTNYLQLLKSQSDPGLSSALWVERAGHCTFTPEELLISVETLENRLESGTWQSPARAPGTAFTDAVVLPLPRWCAENRQACQSLTTSGDHK